MKRLMESHTVLSGSIAATMSTIPYVFVFEFFYRRIGNPLGAVAYLPVVIAISWFRGWKAGLLNAGVGSWLNVLTLVFHNDSTYLLSLLIQSVVY